MSKSHPDDPTCELCHNLRKKPLSNKAFCNHNELPEQEYLLDSSSDTMDFYVAARCLFFYYDS